PVVVAAMPWIYALAWAALRYRLRLDGISVTAAAPSSLFLGVGGVMSAALFLAARTAPHGRWPRGVAWSFVVLTAVMVTGALVRSPRSGVTTTGALELLVEPLRSSWTWRDHRALGGLSNAAFEQEVARLEGEGH
ncbi:MAG: hypothetical protein JWM10_5201, partial [Myxococcaceae bacterium]|nr:hypothetical protein [Myxococcaceae bacterium]